MDRSSYRATSWFDPRVVLRPSPTHGKGIFATAPIHAGEVVVIWGGDVYLAHELPTLTLTGSWSTSLIDDGVLLFSPADAQDYFICLPQNTPPQDPRCGFPARDACVPVLTKSN